MAQVEMPAFRLARIISQCSLLRDANVLWFSEETQRIFAAFAAYATLFHAAERDAEIAYQPAIYPDRPGIDRSATR